MSAIIILVSISFLVAIGFLIAFFSAVKTGQYDDDVTPAVRILFDDEIKNSSLDNTNSSKSTSTSPHKL